MCVMSPRRHDRTTLTLEQTREELRLRYGDLVGVEEARARRWSELVRTAENGTVVALSNDDRDFAVLLPLDRLPVSAAGLEHVPLTQARTDLGHLVRRVAPGGAAPVILIRRHTTPVAALASPHYLLSPQPAPGHRLDADALLARHPGWEIALTFRPWHDEQDLPQSLREEPLGDYIATVYDDTDTPVALGSSDVGFLGAVGNLAWIHPPQSPERTTDDTTPEA